MDKKALDESLEKDDGPPHTHLDNAESDDPKWEKEGTGVVLATAREQEQHLLGQQSARSGE